MHFDACLIAFVDINTDARTLNIARTLVKNNKSVCIIALGIIEDIEKFKTAGIHFIPIRKSDSKKMWKRWISFHQQVKKYKFHIKSKTYWAEDLYSLPLSYAFSRHHKSKLYYDSREIFSALGSMSKNPVKQKILSTIELFFIKYVDEVIVSGELDGEYLSKYFPKNFDYKVIMNLPPYSDKIESNLIRTKFSIANNSPVFLYQGMLHNGRGLVPVLEALEYCPEAVFVILGDGPFKNELNKIIIEKGLTDRVILAGTISYNDLIKWTSSADIGICLIEPISFSYELALPNKLFEYIMARIPVLSSDLPAIRGIYEKYHVGELISTGASPLEIAEKLKQIANDRQKYNIACNEAALKLSYQSQEFKVMELVD